MQSVRFEDAALSTFPSRSLWDSAASELVASMLDRWNLIAGDAYVGGEAGAVLRVTTGDGREAVLKVGFPHVEGHWEAVALEFWGVGLAPEVLRQDAWTWALLLERVDPGGPLSRLEAPTEVALEIAAGLFRDAIMSSSPLELPRSIPTLADIVGTYLMDATARLPAQHSSLDAWGGAHVLESVFGDAVELAAADRSSVLLHGDLNPGNILQRGSQWVLIDPKPMLGDPEFDLFPLIEQLGSPVAQPRPAEVLARHLELMSDLVGCDAKIAARWCVVRAALNVSWQLDDGNPGAVHAGMRELAIWREVSAG